MAEQGLHRFFANRDGHYRMGLVTLVDNNDGEWDSHYILNPTGSLLRMLSGIILEEEWQYT